MPAMPRPRTSFLYDRPLAASAALATVTAGPFGSGWAKILREIDQRREDHLGRPGFSRIPPEAIEGSTAHGQKGWRDGSWPGCRRRLLIRRRPALPFPDRTLSDQQRETATFWADNARLSSLLLRRPPIPRPTLGLPCPGQARRTLLCAASSPRPSLARALRSGPRVPRPATDSPAGLPRPARMGAGRRHRPHGAAGARHGSGRRRSRFRGRGGEQT
jgi:hypothetical protein